MTQVLSSFMTYHRICNQIYTTSTTSGAGTAYLSRAPEFSTGFQWGVLHDFQFYVYVLQIIVCPFVLFCHCVVRPSIYAFLLPFRLWYLETLLKKSCYSFPNRLLCEKLPRVGELKHFIAHLSFCFEETLYRTFHKCFLPNFCSFGN